MNTGIARIRILEAIEKADYCFFCYLENRLEQNYIDNYLYELVMDSGEREKIVESRGFCNYHFHKMFAFSTSPGSSDGLGMAWILKSVAEQLLDDVRAQLTVKRPNEKRLRLTLRSRGPSVVTARSLKIVSNQIRCPACSSISEMVRIYMEDFLSEVARCDELSTIYEEHGVICIPHYVMLSSLVSCVHKEGFSSLSAKITEKQATQLENTISALSEYIAKQDYYYSDKDRAEIKKTVGESFAKIAGRRGIERTLIRILRLEDDVLV